EFNGQYVRLSSVERRGNNANRARLLWFALAHALDIRLVNRFFDGKRRGSGRGRASRRNRRRKPGGVTTGHHPIGDAQAPVSERALGRAISALKFAAVGGHGESRDEISDLRPIGYRDRAVAQRARADVGL